MICIGHSPYWPHAAADLLSTKHENLHPIAFRRHMDEGGKFAIRLVANDKKRRSNVLGVAIEEEKNNQQQHCMQLVSPHALHDLKTYTSGKWKDLQPLLLKDKQRLFALTLAGFS